MDWNYIKHHLLLVGLAVVLIAGAVYGVESISANRAKANDEKWQAILNSQIGQTELLKTQLAQNETKWAAVNAQLLATNQQLTVAISARDRQLSDQLKKNATLTAAEAAQRLEQQTGAKPGEIQTSGDTVVLNLPIARHLADSLDILVATQATLSDTKTQLANQIRVAENLTSNVAQQKDVIKGLETVIEDQKKACEAQVKDVKAQARKSRFKTFFIGVIVGFIGRTVIGH